jgi:hypothetical protein
MGREAISSCTVDGKRFEVKALLEPPELILRGGVRRRVAFAKMKQVCVDAENLTFIHDGERFSLKLGSSIAKRWAQAILAPPPTLAKKLGIDAGTKVRLIGVFDDVALQEAIADAEVIPRGKAGIVLARVNDRAELNAALKNALENAKTGAALWVIYRKGPGHAINESQVRAAGLAAGIVDVKVASVSPALTALKFVNRKQDRK